MKTNQLIYLSSLLLFLFACEDNVSSGSSGGTAETAPPIITPVGADKCDNISDFSGVKEISEIKDTSVKLNWDGDSKSIGYTVFKVMRSGLEVVGNKASTGTSYTVRNLSEKTAYKFLVKTISSVGAYDCNQEVKEVTTVEKQTFISCGEIHEYYAGGKPSGNYEIDTDLEGPKPAFDVYCDMDNNDGGWTRIFTHNTMAGLFLNDSEAKESNIADPGNDKYSILSKLTEFKRDGKYKFWLYYPEHDGAAGGNIWTQTSNPVLEAVSGYASIREDYTGMYWGGLEKSSFSGTLIDGSVGSSWWYYAIGASRNWPSRSTTIPGPFDRNRGSGEVQLFVR